MDDLLRNIIAGDRGAFEELVARLEKPLMNFIYRYVGHSAAAEDIFQETFVRVIKNIEDFSPRVSLKTWIFTIAKNLCLDSIKYRKRHPTLSVDAPAEVSNGKVISFKDMIKAQGASGAEQLERTERERALQRAIGRLPEKKREALVLRVYCDMSYDEISEIVGAPVGTCKFRVHDALGDLQKILAGRKSEGGSA